MPDRFQTALVRYGEELVKSLDPYCIVLFGSFAKGTYAHISDLGLIVVLDGLPDGLRDRLRLLVRLNKSVCDVDALGYTPEEFEKMLVCGHAMALDSMADGIPLHGHDYFAKQQDVFQDMVRHRMHRGLASWRMPTGPAQPRA